MQVEIEDIIHFQSIEQFEDITNLVYDNLTDNELFEALEQWWYPGDHDTNMRDIEDINTNFLGHEFIIHDQTFLLSRYENGLIIGLSRLIKGEL